MLTTLFCVIRVVWDEAAFPDLIRYIEVGEIKPFVARTFPLSDIVAAQTKFSRKEFVGNFVLIPPDL